MFLSDLLPAAVRTVGGTIALSGVLALLSPSSSHGFGEPSAAVVSEANPRVIQLDEFRKILASHDAVIVDARLEDEYRAGHVPGAVNVPRYKLIVSSDEATAKLPKERLVVVYCAGPECQDAKLEAKRLIRLGYRVALFEGGMKEWREHKLPEERAAASG